MDVMNRKDDFCQISIIVPIYNCAKYLPACLDSLRKQTYSNLQIILVDDGSTDNSAQICNQYVKTDMRFLYFYQTNSGVSAARNKGLQVATGEYIGFCDADDWVENDMYENLLRFIQDTDADIAVSSYIATAPLENVIANKCAESETCDGEKAALYMFDNEKYLGFLWNKIFKKKVLQGLFFDTSITLYEDMLFLIEAYRRCERVVFNASQYYHYRDNPTSALHCIFKESDWSALDAQRKLYEFTLKNFPKLENYAKKARIGADLAVADKLAMINELDKKNYLKIKQEIKPYISKYSMQYFSWRRRASVRIFLMGRMPYNLYRKLLKL